jgi:uncharacterized protein (TIGR00369 family)
MTEATMSSSALQRAQAVLAAQPFSALLGAQIGSFGAGGAELHLALRPELLQQHGFAHGGVVSYLADNAITFAGAAQLGAAVVTSEFKINYLRPGLGQLLIARAVTLHAGKRQAVCRCDVSARSAEGSEKLIAVAQGTIAVLAESAAT